MGKYVHWSLPRLLVAEWLKRTSPHHREFTIERERKGGGKKGLSQYVRPNSHLGSPHQGPRSVILPLYATVHSFLTGTSSQTRNSACSSCSLKRRTNLPVVIHPCRAGLEKYLATQNSTIRDSLTGQPGDVGCRHRQGPGCHC